MSFTSENTKYNQYNWMPSALYIDFPEPNSDFQTPITFL